MFGTILLVENEYPMLEFISDALADAGFLVVRAASGQEAIRELAENADHLHALITDIGLGPGPDGWDVGRVARQALPSLPVLYISGDGLHQWPAHGVTGSMFLSKPFRLSHLMDHVEALFGRNMQAAGRSGVAGPPLLGRTGV